MDYPSHAMMPTGLPNLVLRAATEGDLDTLCELFRHPGIAPLLSGGNMIARDSVKRMLERSSSCDLRLGELWMIEAQPAGCVGFCGITAFEVPPARHSIIGKGFHIQVALHPNARGRGLATHAIEALARHAFSDLGLERICAFALESNEPAHRLLMRCEFSEIGRLAGSKLVAYERRG